MMAIVHNSHVLHEGAQGEAKTLPQVQNELHKQGEWCEVPVQGDQRGLGINHIPSQ